MGFRNIRIVPSPHWGEGQGEGGLEKTLSLAPPQPALRADLSPKGRGDRTVAS